MDGTVFGICMKHSFHYDKDTGWFFLCAKPWTIYIRLNSLLNFPIPSHCHQDFGAPVIFYNNSECLVDVGRSSYLPENFNEVLASNHSTFLIDGKPTELSERDIPFIPFLKQSIKYKFSLFENRINILYRYPLSIENRKKVKYAIRLLVIREDSVKIIDRISLLKKCQISSSFYFSKSIKNLKLKFTYKLDKAKTAFLLLNKDSETLQISKRSLNYNKTIECKSYKIKKLAGNFFTSMLLIEK